MSTREKAIDITFGGLMTVATSESKTKPLLLDVSNTTLHVTSEQFDKLCLDNPDLRLEMMSNGELLVMPSSFPISGKHNINLGSQVYIWDAEIRIE
jgi:Uma2 family endonuclease